MTMKEKLQIHRMIETENHEHLELWQAMVYWDSMTAEEVASMIQEKDRAMEWDDQFSFLCDLLERKIKEGKTA